MITDTDPHAAPQYAVAELEPEAPVRPAFIGAFESTYLPRYDVDVAESTDHVGRWREDIDVLADAGVRSMRYSLRWHRIEAQQGVFDWSGPDAEFAYLRERGIEPIVDLVHHTSYPTWLTDGFRDRRFGPAYLRYAEAVARRYPSIPAYTLFNEPFATLFLAGHEGLWPPYDLGIDGFIGLLRNVLPPLVAAAELYRELLPDADHVWIDTCESHSGEEGASADYAALANDRRHVVLDLVLGHGLDPQRPFLAQLLAAGGADLLLLTPIRIDLLGLDYYCHSEWWYDGSGSHAPSPHPLGFAAIAEQYWLRYGLPLLLSETNVRGLPSDRASWLRYCLEQYDLAVARGVPLRGFCWFPVVDSSDWDSLLARPAGRADPVGVLGLAADRSRIRTSFTEVWEAAAAGAAPDSLPAYRFQPPCDSDLAGLLPQMAHWNWEDPPRGEVIPPIFIGESEGTE